MRRIENEWKEDNLALNQESLNRMRSLIPENIQALSVEALLESAKSQGVLYTRDLANYLKQNKYELNLISILMNANDDNSQASTMGSYPRKR